MRPADPQTSSYLSQPSWQSRAVAFAAAFGIALLIVAMLIMLGELGPAEKKHEADLVTIPIVPVRQVETVRARHAAKARPSGGAPAHVPVPRPAPAPKAEAKTPTVPWNVLSLTAQEMAAADISKMPAHAQVAQVDDGGEGEGQGSGAGKNSGVVYGPSEGPGGETVYYGDWYREPTDAEMNTYLPEKYRSNSRYAATEPVGGQGTVLCRITEHYHVENCREETETPGSGLARAVRLASWQFLIRPPAVNGKPLIGAWVRIRFTIKEMRRGASGR